MMFGLRVFLAQRWQKTGLLWFLIGRWSLNGLFSGESRASFGMVVHKISLI